MSVWFSVHRGTSEMETDSPGWSVKWDYCPASASHSHARKHAHTQQTHMSTQVEHNAGVETEIQKAELVDWVPVQFLVFPSAAAASELLG